MSKIRTFTPDDLGAVIALRRRAFRRSRWQTDAELGQYFSRVFFQNPWRDHNLPALVYEDAGAILGFAGVLPRSYRLAGNLVHGAVFTQLMTAPEAQGKGVSTALMARVFGGPQDLIIADSVTPPVQRNWVRHQGSNKALLQSMYWSKTLRPMGNAINAGGSTFARRLLRRSLSPLSAIGDSIILRLNPIRPAGAREPLTPDIMAQLPALASPDILVPDYDVASAQWLLEQVATKWNQALVVKKAVRVDSHVVGWFIYVLQPDRNAQVVQLIAERKYGSVVLDHLFEDARSADAVVASGRIEPQLLDDLNAKQVRFSYGGPALMVHVKDPALHNQILRGEAVFTGLEGEWWMAF